VFCVCMCRYKNFAHRKVGAIQQANCVYPLSEGYMLFVRRDTGVIGRVFSLFYSPRAPYVPALSAFGFLCISASLLGHALCYLFVDSFRDLWDSLTRYWIII
jgi:hypothetical protein